jgi:hypothetical protein
VRSRSKKQQAWVEDKVDEEIVKNKTAEEYAVTKQNAGYTPIINTEDCCKSVHGERQD